MVTRFTLLKELSELVADDVLVLTSIGNNSGFWGQLKNREANLFHLTMGMCSSTALGLSLALPNRKIVALDSDGNLTLNLGIRWDFATPPKEKSDWFSDFTADRPNPAVNNYPGALRFAGFGEGRENSDLAMVWPGQHASARIRTRTKKLAGNLDFSLQPGSGTVSDLNRSKQR